MTPAALGTTTLAVVVGMVLAGSLSGCSDEPSQQEAETAVCQDLVDVQAAADDLRALDTGSTLDEAEAARDALGAAVDDLKQSVADVPDADSSAIEAARSEIADEIQGVSGSDTLSAAATAIQGSTGSLQAAIAEINDGLSCGVATPTS